MPELPEVETVARQLHPLLAGHRIRELIVCDHRLVVTHPERLRERQIAGVARVGKQVAIEIAGTEIGPKSGLWLAVHLRMTGRLVVATDAPIDTGKRRPPHLRAVLKFDGGEMRFFDQRRFGTMTLTADFASLQPDGVEPLSRQTTAAKMAALIGQSPQAIKLWLMRQDKLVGVGNIYASEILFDAGLHPERPAKSLSPGEIAALTASTKKILRAAIANCGTTFSDFQDAHGVTGSYQQFLKVYQREGEPCGACGTPIQRIVQGQRSTFFCPSCQPQKPKTQAKSKPPTAAKTQRKK